MPASPPSPAYRTTPIPRQSAPARTPAEPPADTVPFTWSCQCLNVTCFGRIRKDVHQRIEQNEASGSQKAKQSEATTSAWVGEEHAKQPAYVIYEGPGEKRGRERMPSGDRDGAWRRCLLCDVKVYRVTGQHYRDHPSADETWVDIQLDRFIVYGKALDDIKNEPLLPFSGLHLPLDTARSDFGRPHRKETESLRNPIDMLQDIPDYPIKDPLSRPTGLKLIPVEVDTFFLHPPFLPNHPVLQNLCESSVKFLGTRHRELEAEIVHFMQQKTDEMRRLEDQVRNEVEMLWNTYRATNPDTNDMINRRRGSKVEDPRSRSREPPQRKFSPSPVVLNTFKQNQARPRGTGDDQLAQSHLDVPVRIEGEQSFAAGSLLTSALSANPQRPSESAVEPPIKSPETKGEPSTMAVGSLLTSSLSANPQRTPAPPSDPPIKSPEETVNDYLAEAGRLDKKKDGRAVAMSHMFSELDSQISKLSASKAKDLHERANRYGSPVPDMVIPEEPSLEATPSGSVKEGDAVEYVSPQSSLEEEDKTGHDKHDEDEVFEFELDEDKGEGSTSTTQPFQRGDDGLRFAAHAPSHRAGWKKTEKTGKFPWYENKNIHDRPSPSRLEELENDDSKVSSLATSMPVHIARRPLRSIGITELEKKTSLSEREGKLVPPLRMAMKKKAEASGSSSTARPPRTLAEGETQSGVTQQEGFVPPHVQIREEEKAKAKAAGGSMSIYDKYQ